MPREGFCPAAPSRKKIRAASRWAAARNSRSVARARSARRVTAASGSDLSATLATPSGSLARLLCPRVLTSDTDYLACVVPAFELGRKAGLGQPITPEDEAQLAPAWDLSSSAVELPVYYSWRFATGAGGDFQSLAMLLTARPLPPGIGERPIDVGDMKKLTSPPSTAVTDGPPPFVGKWRICRPPAEVLNCSPQR